MADKKSEEEVEQKFKQYIMSIVANVKSTPPTPPTPQTTTSESGRVTIKSNLKEGKKLTPSNSGATQENKTQTKSNIYIYTC